ncbi:winged helix-turn-helix domain-containing protein [Arthrobacter castelli]|uniref:winged helix-turn-helix domain-containing protein n=1 Tax=Arthrobacter castelli TaxID=271431 RepID=UPI00040F74F8|nr:helix-turn-helix domain-containing protein [Arthrobacter castelli]
MNASPEAGEPKERTVDLTSLKVLAHPLRVQILERLSRHGAQTSSSLAEVLGESSGATSYHLRQLAKHNFVREVAGKGTGRERWWERPPGALNIPGRDLAGDPAGREALRLVNREFEQLRGTALTDFMTHGLEELPAEWVDASSINTHHLHMTVEEMEAASRALEEATNRILAPYRADKRERPEDARPIEVHLNSFPLVDGQRRDHT